ncbi:MAG: anaerobic ribonucleoside-triphosphate reductase activating protein [Candidatus Bipolaricaulota bacterium]
MKIGGLQKLSLLDFPGHPAAIVFTMGCNFRCPWCHNGDLVFQERSPIPEGEIFEFLSSREGLLEGVVLTGGEPLIHDEIADFLQRVRNRGFKIKLDTNGSFPTKLEELIDRGLLDYIAMDIKAPPGKYSKAAGVEVDFSQVEQSIHLIKEFEGDSEFRTTVLPFLDEKDFKEIGKLAQGVDRFALQQFKIPEGKQLVEPRLIEKTPEGSEEKARKMKPILEDYITELEVR